MPKTDVAPADIEALDFEPKCVVRWTKNGIDVQAECGRRATKLAYKRCGAVVPMCTQCAEVVSIYPKMECGDCGARDDTARHILRIEPLK